MKYVRFESASPNGRGVHIGVFGLVNGLARTGTLNEDDMLWWRTKNDELDLAYPNPALTDPTLFDRLRHPETTCWFKSTATNLIASTIEYCNLLDRYAIAWRRVDCDDPGAVLYEDAVQIVVEAPIR